MVHPWGLLGWALGLTEPRQWEFIGCLGTEERSLGAYFALADRQLLTQSTLLRIEESNSPTAILAAQRIGQREQECRERNLRPTVASRQLLDPVTSMDPLCHSANTRSLVLDITSLPKRYFFYLLKRLFQSDSVRDLVITYSVPERYASDALSEDVDPWDALPTFRPPDPDQEKKARCRLIVNVGFMPEGLAAHIEGPDVEKRIDLIIPFPSPVAAVQRAWQSVLALTSMLPETRFGEHRVGAHDMSEAFQRILTLLPDESNLVSFAPFGPKPISAAICLYATLTGSPIYYAQPKVYNPDYSVGIAKVGGKSEIYAYWVKHNGRKLFELPGARKDLRD